MQATGLALSGNYAYLVATTGSYSESGELHAIDVSDPAKPVRVGGYRLGVSENYNFPRGLSVVDNLVYVAGMREEGGKLIHGLHILDVSHLANPILVGGYDIEGVREVAVANNLIYLALGARGLAILEQSRPPWLEITGQDPVTLSLSGDANSRVRIQRSSNLSEWTDWQAIRLGSAPTQLSDLEAAAESARFYRAIAP